VIEYYRDGFLRTLNTESFPKSNLKVVVDFGFGGASEILPAILGALDIEVVALNAYPDPDRVYNHSQQEDKARKQLSAIVKSLKADAGFLIGPGAEKLTVVDENGKVIDNQVLLCLILSLYLEKVRCKKIAVPVVASSRIEAIAKKHKIELVRIPDDHLAMMDALHKDGADFVGGTKGGFIFPGFQIGCDAMFAVAKILELITSTGKRLGDVKRDWPDINIISKEIPCSWTRKGLVMRRLMKHTARKKRILVDGVRFSNNASIITIKPDRYKASFYLQVESKSQDKAKSNLKEYASKIKQWQLKNRR